MSRKCGSSSVGSSDNWCSRFVDKHKHRRTGLEIWGGGADMNLPDSRRRRENLGGGGGGMLPRKILKNRVSLMPFPAFWCGFLCMEQVTNEKKILRILVKQNMNRKIALLLSKNCPNN